MCSETTVVIRPEPVAGPVSFTSPCLCAKPSYRGLANPPQCQTPLGLIAKPGLCPEGTLGYLSKPADVPPWRAGAKIHGLR